MNVVYSPPGPKQIFKPRMSLKLGSGVDDVVEDLGNDAGKELGAGEAPRA